MITCIKCGNELPDNAKFCGKCGTPLHPVAPAPVVEESPVVEAAPVLEETPVSSAKPATPGSILRSSASTAHLVSAEEAASAPVAPPIAVPVPDVNEDIPAENCTEATTTPPTYENAMRYESPYNTENAVPKSPAYEMPTNLKDKGMTAFEEAMSKKRKNQESAFDLAKKK